MKKKRQFAFLVSSAMNHPAPVYVVLAATAEDALAVAAREFAEDAPPKIVGRLADRVAKRLRLQLGEARRA